MIHHHATGIKTMKFATITKLELIKAPKGHQAHTSGTGVQKDKRTKRNRTRADQNRKAIQE